MVETISREDAAWLAGIIEGEGSLMLTRHVLAKSITIRSCVSVTNTNAKLIKGVSEIWYKLGCKFYYQLKKTKNGYALSIVSYGRNSTNRILELVEPFLRTKTDQAELLIAFNKEMGKGRYQRWGIERYKALQLEYLDKLYTMRVKTVNPQRLQRTASKPLDIG